MAAPSGVPPSGCRKSRCPCDEPFCRFRRQRQQRDRALNFAAHKINQPRLHLHVLALAISQQLADDGIDGLVGDVKLGGGFGIDAGDRVRHAAGAIINNHDRNARSGRRRRIRRRTGYAGSIRLRPQTEADQ